MVFRPASGSYLPLRGFTFTLIRHTIHGRTFLDECSARRREFFLTTHNNLKRQTSMSLRGFEPASLACESPQTHTIDLAAAGIGDRNIYLIEIMTSQFCSHISTKETKREPLSHFRKLAQRICSHQGYWLNITWFSFPSLTRLNSLFKLSYS